MRATSVVTWFSERVRISRRWALRKTRRLAARARNIICHYARRITLWYHYFKYLILIGGLEEWGTRPLRYIQVVPLDICVNTLIRRRARFFSSQEPSIVPRELHLSMSERIRSWSGIKGAAAALFIALTIAASLGYTLKVLGAHPSSLQQCTQMARSILSDSAMVSSTLLGFLFTLTIFAMQMPTSRGNTLPTLALYLVRQNFGFLLAGWTAGACIVSLGLYALGSHTVLPADFLFGAAIATLSLTILSATLCLAYFIQITRSSTSLTLYEVDNVVQADIKARGQRDFAIAHREMVLQNAFSIFHFSVDQSLGGWSNVTQGEVLIRLTDASSDQQIDNVDYCVLRMLGIILGPRCRPRFSGSCRPGGRA